MSAETLHALGEKESGNVIEGGRYRRVDVDNFSIRMRHFTHENEACYKCECGTSHM